MSKTYRLEDFETEAEAFNVVNNAYEKLQLENYEIARQFRGLSAEMIKFKNNEDLSCLKPLLESFEVFKKFESVVWLPDNFVIKEGTGKLSDRGLPFYKGIEELKKGPKRLDLTVKEFEVAKLSVLTIQVPNDLLTNPIVKTLNIVRKLLRNINFQGEGFFYTAKFTMNYGKKFVIYFEKGGSDMSTLRSSFIQNMEPWDRDTASKLSLEQFMYVFASFQNLDLLTSIYHWQDMHLLRKNIKEKQDDLSNKKKTEINIRTERNDEAEEMLNQLKKVRFDEGTQTDNDDQSSEVIKLKEELKNLRLERNQLSVQINSGKTEATIRNEVRSELLDEHKANILKLQTAQQQKIDFLKKTAGDLELSLRNDIAILRHERTENTEIISQFLKGFKLGENLTKENSERVFRRLVENACKVCFDNRAFLLLHQNENLVRDMVALKQLAAEQREEIHHLVLGGMTDIRTDIKREVAELFEVNLRANLDRARMQLDQWKNDIEQLSKTWSSLPKKARGLNTNLNVSDEKKIKQVKHSSTEIDEKIHWEEIDETQITTNEWLKRCSIKNFLSNEQSMPHDSRMAQGEWWFQKNVNIRKYREKNRKSL